MAEPEKKSAEGQQPQGYGMQQPMQGYGMQQQQPAIIYQQPGQPPLPPGPQPASQQPIQWMAAPTAPPGCPPGLEYLTMVDQLIVKQQIELLEAFTGWETNNKYMLTNSIGQQVFYALERTDCCTRACCGPGRPFEMEITDNRGVEVLHLHRPLKCQLPCFPCCLQELEVTGPPGTVLGHIVQDWTCMTPKFTLKDASDQIILTIEGPVCHCRCSDVEFKVLSADGATQVGSITKQWMGLVREAFTDADTFGVTFPMDMDVKAKAVLLGATFLIDFMFFEKKK